MNIIYMYIFFSFLITFIFFNNMHSIFLVFFFFFFLIFFFNMKNLVFFFESYSLGEDRIIIILENITRVEYNYFFIAFFLLFIIHLTSSSSNIVFTILFTICFLNYNFYFQYQDFYLILFSKFRFNTKLLNGLFLIHPFMVYLFYCFLMAISINLLNFTFIKFYFNNYNPKHFTMFNLLKNFKYSIFLGLTAIILGSWWAFQEINWNGWWSWDLIEIVNLLLILIVLKYIHNSNLLKCKNFLSVSIDLFVILLLPIFFMGISRFNLVNSLHSFVLLDNFSQFYFIIQFVILFWFFLYTYIKKINMRVDNYNYTLKSINFLPLFFYLFFIIFFYKLIYELLVFFINAQSFLEYFYFFKHYLNFLLVSIIFLANSWNLSFLLPFFNILFFSFIEIILINLIFILFYNKSFEFFKWHVFIFIFFLLNFFNLYLLDFSYKNWNFNFLSFIENFKINYNITMGNSFVLKNYINNYFCNKLNFYSIQTNEISLLSYNSSNVYFLSDFWINNNSFSITSYKFFFYYSYVFTKYLSLYYIIYSIAYYFIILLNKKLDVPLI